MNQTSNRCRHFEVNWINSHTCRCSGCSKTGHWFEPEGLVMWVLEKANQDHEKTINSANQIQSMTVAENSLSSRAG